MWEHPDMPADPLMRELMVVLSLPTGTSSAGYPYLQRPAWERLRDWTPMLFANGQAVWEAAERLQQHVATTDDPTRLDAPLRVLRQVVQTAAITAPPDLWLLRHVLSALAQVGLAERILHGQVVDAEQVRGLLTEELHVDLEFLLARGYLSPAPGGLRLASTTTARQVFEQVGIRSPHHPVDASSLWTELFAGSASPLLVKHVHRLISEAPPAPQRHEAPAWVANAADIHLGAFLVPFVLGLRAAHRLDEVLERGSLDGPWLTRASDVLRDFQPWLHSAGVVRADGALTAIGRRVLQRGPGPFGIIETYHPYLAALPTLWEQGRGELHVRRAGNIAASLDANRDTFRRANDTLDRLCADTGFRYQVFIEHALGYGEATRQRWERAGDAPLAYVGADLEVEAIDAARSEQRAGRLPPDMLFVPKADIADPTSLFRAIRIAGHATQGAVMMVGNGFHEVRATPDQPLEERLEEVFRLYERAGVVLVFTEASALSTEDLLNTAWNTYHAGFRYVHARSGQGLRPAATGPVPRVGDALPPSWAVVARRAGYVRATPYCTRSRTIYPYPPSDGHNPSISENHVLLPRALAQQLGFPLDNGADHG